MEVPMETNTLGAAITTNYSNTSAATGHSALYK